MAAEIVSYSVRRISPRVRSETRDSVVVEEPIEIRVNGTAQAVLMRTPLHDFDLAVGFCLTEALVASPRDIDAVRYGDPAEFNVVEVALRAGVPGPDARRRATVASAACGLCGKTSLDAVRVAAAGVTGDAVRVRADTLFAMPLAMRAVQATFDATGGLHGAALFTPDGDPICVREDVGRHNAVDKVCGHLAREGTWPDRSNVLCVSGRAGFEVVQKAAMAAIPVLVAVSAPSSLAVDLAHELGLTLVAFARDRSANVYTHAQRIV